MTDFHRCIDCAFWQPALTYYGEPTGQGGCQFSVARNRKGDKLRECDHFQAPIITITESSTVAYEALPGSIWEKAWAELYRVYSERLDQDNVDLMDSLFKAVVADYQKEGEE